MYSGEYDACDVTLSVYPHRASLKNMPDHGGNRTYDLWNTRRSSVGRALGTNSKGRRFDSHRGQRGSYGISRVVTQKIFEAQSMTAFLACSGENSLKNCVMLTCIILSIVTL